MMMLNLKHELMKKSMNSTIQSENAKKKDKKKYTLDMTTHCISTSIGFMMREEV